MSPKNKEKGTDKYNLLPIISGAFNPHNTLNGIFKISVVPILKCSCKE